MPSDSTWFESLPRAGSQTTRAAPITIESATGSEGAPVLTARPPQAKPVTGGDWFDQLPKAPVSGPAVKSDYPVHPGQMTGLSANMGAGLKQAAIDLVSGVAGAPADLMLKPLQSVSKAMGWGDLPSQQEMIAKGLEAIGGSPKDVVPGDAGDKLARAATYGAAGMAFPGAAAGFATGAARSAPGVLGAVRQGVSPSGIVGGAVGGVAGQVAEDAVPEGWKPAANIAGNVVAGSATMAGMQGLASLGRPVAEAVGRLGIGRKQSFGETRATPQQAQSAVGMVDDAMGSAGWARLAQKSGIEDRAQALETIIANTEAPPSLRAQAMQELRTIQGQRLEMVPGAQPTLGQVVPTPGVVSLEKVMRTGRPDPFLARSGAQSEAMVESLQKLAPTGAEPHSVGRLFTQHLDNLEQRGQQAIGQARTDVQGATQRLGATGTPELYGQEVRGFLKGHQEGEAMLAGRMFEMIDPDGKLALSTAPVKDAARMVKEGIDPRDWVYADPTVKRWVETLERGSGVELYKKFQQNWSDLSGDIRTMLRQRVDPESRPLRMLNQLKNGMKASIEGAVDNVANVEAEAVAAGRMAPEQTLVSRLQNEAEAWRAGRQQASARGTGGGDIGGGTRGGQTALPGMAGTTRPGQGGPGSNAGVQGISGAAEPLTPNMTPEQAAQYTAANRNYAQYKQTYRANEVGDVLRPDASGFNYRVLDSDVTRKFLHGGVSEPEAVRRYVEAVGGMPRAVESMRNGLVSDLHRSGIVDATGEVNLPAFTRWQRKHSGTIDQFEGLRGQFETATAAQQTLDETLAGHTRALKEFERSAAGTFLNADPAVAVGRAFGSGNSTQTFKELVRLVRGHPDAEAGLKRAVVDYIDRRFSSAKPSGDESDFLKQKQFRDWTKDHKGALKALFTGQGSQNIEMVAAELRRQVQATAIPATPGSDTAQKIMAAQKHGFGFREGGTVTALAVVGHFLGENIGKLAGGPGLVGSATGAAVLGGGYLIRAMHQAGISTINDMVQEMMLNPKFALEMRARVTNNTISPMTAKRIAMSLHGTMVNNVLSHSNQETKQ